MIAAPMVFWTDRFHNPAFVQQGGPEEVTCPNFPT
jgi:hypothetical protein